MKPSHSKMTTTSAAADRRHSGNINTATTNSNNASSSTSTTSFPAAAAVAAAAAPVLPCRPPRPSPVSRKRATSLAAGISPPTKTKRVRQLSAPAANITDRGGGGGGDGGGGGNSTTAGIQPAVFRTRMLVDMTHDIVKNCGPSQTDRHKEMQALKRHWLRASYLPPPEFQEVWSKAKQQAWETLGYLMTSSPSATRKVLREPPPPGGGSSAVQLLQIPRKSATPPSIKRLARRTSPESTARPLPEQQQQQQLPPLPPLFVRGESGGAANKGGSGSHGTATRTTKSHNHNTGAPSSSPPQHRALLQQAAVAAALALGDTRSTGSPPAGTKKIASVTGSKSSMTSLSALTKLARQTSETVELSQRSELTSSPPPPPFLQQKQQQQQQQQRKAGSNATTNRQRKDATRNGPQRAGATTGASVGAGGTTGTAQGDTLRGKNAPGKDASATSIGHAHSEPRRSPPHPPLPLLQQQSGAAPEAPERSATATTHETATAPAGSSLGTHQPVSPTVAERPNDENQESATATTTNTTTASNQPDEERADTGALSLSAPAAGAATDPPPEEEHVDGGGGGEERSSKNETSAGGEQELSATEESELMKKMMGDIVFDSLTIKGDTIQMRKLYREKKALWKKQSGLSEEYFCFLWDKVKDALSVQLNLEFAPAEQAEQDEDRSGSAGEGVENAKANDATDDDGALRFQSLDQDVDGGQAKYADKDTCSGTADAEDDGVTSVQAARLVPVSGDREAVVAAVQARVGEDTRTEPTRTVPLCPRDSDECMGGNAGNDTHRRGAAKSSAVSQARNDIHTIDTATRTTLDDDAGASIELPDGRGVSPDTQTEPMQQSLGASSRNDQYEEMLSSVLDSLDEKTQGKDAKRCYKFELLVLRNDWRKKLNVEFDEFTSLWERVKAAAEERFDDSKLEQLYQKITNDIQETVYNTNGSLANIVKDSEIMWKLKLKHLRPETFASLWDQVAKAVVPATEHSQIEETATDTSARPSSPQPPRVRVSTIAESKTEVTESRLELLYHRVLSGVRGELQHEDANLEDVLRASEEKWKIELEQLPPHKFSSLWNEVEAKIVAEQPASATGTDWSFLWVGKNYDPSRMDWGTWDSVEKKTLN